MKLQDVIRFQNIRAAAAGTQATVADSRSADEWIKNYLSDKQKRLDDLRKTLHNLLDRPPKLDEYMRPEMKAAFRADKLFPLQKPGRVGGTGRWAVITPDGEILSRWETKAEADAAAWPLWRGIKPSATGPTGGARVVELGDEDEVTTNDILNVEAADIFDTPELQEKTRNKHKVLRHPKPRAVQDADILRLGDRRPSSHGQGSAGTGGAGAGGAGGGTGI